MELHQELAEDILMLQSVTGELNLKTHTDQHINLNENSPFTVVHDSSNNEYIVRKSSICWLLNKHKERLSADRLVRMREIEVSRSFNKVLIFQNNFKYLLLFFFF